MQIAVTKEIFSAGTEKRDTGKKDILGATLNTK